MLILAIIIVLGAGYGMYLAVEAERPPQIRRDYTTTPLRRRKP